METALLLARPALLLGGEARLLLVLEHREVHGQVAQLGVGIRERAKLTQRQEGLFEVFHPGLEGSQLAAQVGDQEPDYVGQRGLVRDLLEK